MESVHKTFFQTFISAIAIGTASLSFAEGYDRKDFNYHSYKPNTSIGLPKAPAQNFEATATADPLLDPPGILS